ncbi:hypothetical protein M758_6G139000 [Ceratodon purpureus]|nr:hypothetical protein M758_6G139000 [Ceratodon purpureus]
MMPPGFGFLENGNGRPPIIMAAGGIGMLSPVRPVPVEVWDIKAMAAHRHRILATESSAHRMEMEAHMQAIPAQACPPGFRPPPLHSDLPTPNFFPPGFRPPSAYNEALLPQNCPPGFRPPVQCVESATIMQPEKKFRSTDSITYRPELRLDDRSADSVGKYDIMRGPSMCGAADRHGWYPNESSSSAGRLLESRFVDPQLSKPYTRPREPQDEHVQNLYRGAELENENWRQEALLTNGQLLASSVPVSNVTPPLAYNPDAFWPGNMRGDNLASTREAGKRRSFEGVDNSPRTPPFKRPRTGHEVDRIAPAWARSRLESEIAWSNGLQMSDDKSRDRAASHPSSLHKQKQIERRNKNEFSNGTVDRWHDRQESRTRRSPPHYRRGSLSPRDRNQAPARLEVSKKPECRSRPSSFRAISQNDRSSLRASPRPVYSNGKEKQYRSSPCFDTRIRPSDRGSCSPRLGLRSRSPNNRSNYDRASLRAGERSWRRDSWPPRLLAGKTSPEAEIDKPGAHWRSAEVPGRAERKSEENGSLTILHSSQVVEEHAKDDKIRGDSQFPNVLAKEHCGTEGNVVEEMKNSLDNAAPASTDRTKNSFSLPLRAGSIQRLPEMKPKAEPCESLERNLPLPRNDSQFATEKAGSSSVPHRTNSGENQFVGIKPISAASLKITRYFTNAGSAPKYHASQHSEMDWKTLPEKVTHWRRRTVVVSAGQLVAKISGSDEGAALLEGEQDEAEEGEILHTENSSKSLLGLRLPLERSSIAPETGIIEGGLSKPSVCPSRVSSEVAVHSQTVVRGTENQVATVSKVDSCSNERAGHKWISTGVRSKHIPSVKLPKMASVSDLQPPDSLGKSHTSGGCMLAEEAPGNPCSQQMDEASPTSTARNGRVSVVAGVKRSSDNPSVPTSELALLDREKETCTAGELKSDAASFKNSAIVSETQNPKLTFMSEKSFLQGSSVKGQKLERDRLVNSGTEVSFRSSSSSCVGDAIVKPFVGESRSLLDDWLFGITSSIPLNTETNNGFQPNDSTSKGLQVSVTSKLQDSLISDGDKQVERPSALVIEKTTSVTELAKVVVDNKKAAVVQGKQDTKVVAQPSDLRDTSATGRDNLARPRNKEGPTQGDFTRKVASFLTDAGSPLVTEMTKAKSVVSQRSDLQDLRNSEGNTRVEQTGKVIMRGAGLATNLLQVVTEEGKGEVALSDSDDDFEVITEPSREVFTTVMHFDRELGKRRKIMHPEKGGNLKQVTTADKPKAKIKKSDLLELSSGAEKFKADSILTKKHMPSLEDGLQRTSPVLKTVDTLSVSSHLSVSPAVTPPLRTVGHSYMSNKTWRREVTPVNSQQFSNTLQRPAVVAQPSTYIRKKFSIIRNPAPQVPPQSNAGFQTTALSKFPQGSVTQSRNKTYSLSASKSVVHHQVSPAVAKTAVAASASPGVKTSNTKMNEIGAMPSQKPSPSPVRKLPSLGNETLLTHFESIVSGSLPVSQNSPSKPSHCEGSSGSTTLAYGPANKSPGGATDEAVGYVVSGTRLYRKRKCDQVHVGPATTSASPILKTGSEKCDVPLGYIKRKTNQLVRCDHPEASANDALQNVVEGGDQVKFINKQKRHTSQLKTKTKLGRVLSQKKGRLLGLARVWTLSNEGKHTTTALGASRDWRYPLFPWKRSAVAAPRLRRGRPLHEGKTGALFFHISNQLQKYRSAHPVYTKSADGFSLHRSGVVSKSGANLKWTKSLKTQSIIASEAATKVVAEAEKKKRDKKEAVVMAVAKARDERRAKLRSGSGNSFSVSSLKSLGIGGAVYVRKGFGNQLVRNLKTVARVVASEKFRWSLRNARLRRAKKQSYCVYYTRFGVCKRGDGKCLYIHDPEKVAVCTKFLRGSCSDSACRLTHKIIPERMSDCSYFLEGLCTNESCPYRHVNVNKEAPICEAFLQGYCADGDKVRHTILSNAVLFGCEM